MKNFFALILFLSSFCFCFSQNTKPKIDKAALLEEQIQGRAILRLEVARLSSKWRNYVYDKASNGMSNTEAVNYFDNYLSENNNNTSPELINLRTNKKEIDLLLNDFVYFGSEKSVFAANRMPLSIIQTDTGKVFFLSGLFTDNIYNTLKLTSRQRAAKVLSSGLIEKLGTMNQMITDKTIKYFAIGAVYGSKNFAESDGVMPVAEYVFIISPRSLIIKYTLGAITVDEFVNRSSIFLSDRDNFGANIKVKIVME